MRFLKIVAYCCLPLTWGYFSWFMAWGPGGKIIPYGCMNLLIRFIVGTSFALLFFFNSFKYSNKYYTPTFFGDSLRIAPWYIFLTLTFFSIVVSCFFNPLWEYPLVESLVLGVLLSSCIEELFTRSVFIKYSFSIWEFILVNSLMSITFALMHKGYCPNVDLAQFLTRGHIEFSFILGIIAYKTKRIEIPLVLHIASNFLRYTLPVCILGIQTPYPVSILLEICLYLCIMGSGHLYKNANSNV